ncbi:hypothetical protein FACS1894159_05250 [Bacteroidia bacterium]|nr:hypothetical protein FACS1894159_05250 [Bacteroidia bacterium]
MNKRIFIPLAALLALTFSSCLKQELDERATPQIEGELSELPVSFVVEDFQGDAEPVEAVEETRAPQTGINEGATVTDAWLLQFDGTTDAAKLVAPPQYLTGTALTQPVSLLEGTTNNIIVAIANMSNAGYQWKMTPGVTTYADMKAAAATVMYESENYHHSRLLLSGIWTGTVNSAANITFPLKRNDAKIYFSIANTTGSGLTISSVQLCNIPTRLDLLANDITIAANTVYPGLAGSTYIDYPVETVTIAPGALQNFVWYTPQNRQTGTASANADHKLKNRLARPGATCVKIIASNAAGDNYVYRFYLGANMTNDFDLLPNTRYVTRVTLNGPGDPNIDERVTKNDIVDTFGKSANSYIINPPESAGTTRTYLIYPKQINTFFNVVDGYEPSANAYIGSVANTDPQRWTARVVWSDLQDSPVVFHNASPTIDMTKVNVVIDPQLRGEDMALKVVVPAGVQPMNFTIGFFDNKDGNQIQDINEPITWSIHCWVTDYNPDVKVVVSPSQYVYAAKNGAVHRYGGTLWTSGIYANAVIMDRNLGSFKVREYINQAMRGQLYYQFGRKDPFPALYCPLYVPTAPGISAGAVSIAKTPGGPGTGVGIQSSLSAPLTYFTSINSATRDWDEEEEIPLRIWKDKLLNVNITTSTAKSLFDPCPYGWQLPHNNTWADFTATGSNASSGEYFGPSSTMNSVSRGLTWTKDNYIGLRYFPGTGMPEAEIYYPASGFIVAHDVTIFNMSNILNNTYLWSGLPNSQTLGRSIVAGYSTTSMGSGTNTSRVHAMAVRCVKIVAN